MARERAGSTRKKRSKTRSWYSAAMPMPRSITAISAQSPSRRREIDTEAWAGE